MRLGRLRRSQPTCGDLGWRAPACTMAAQGVLMLGILATGRITSLLLGIASLVFVLLGASIAQRMELAGSFDRERMDRSEQLLIPPANSDLCLLPSRNAFRRLSLQDAPWRPMTFNELFTSVRRKRSRGTVQTIRTVGFKKSIRSLERPLLRLVHSLPCSFAYTDHSCTRRTIGTPRRWLGEGHLSPDATRVARAPRVPSGPLAPEVRASCTRLPSVMIPQAHLRRIGAR